MPWRRVGVNITMFLQRKIKRDLKDLNPVHRLILLLTLNPYNHIDGLRCNFTFMVFPILGKWGKMEALRMSQNLKGAIVYSQIHPTWTYSKQKTLMLKPGMEMWGIGELMLSLPLVWTLDFQWNEFLSIKEDLIRRNILMAEKIWLVSN